MPPSTAMAIAIPSSVTVSMAALTTGVFRVMCREKRLADARVTRQDLGVLRNQQDIVESQAQQRLAQARAPPSRPDAARPIVVAISPPSSLRSVNRPCRPIRAWRPASGWRTFYGSRAASS